MGADSTRVAGRVDVIVVRGKEVLRRCTVRCEGGSLAISASPSPAGGGDEEDGPETSRPDVTLTLTDAHAEAVASGALDPSVAYMRGQMKMEGDSALLLAFLPLTRGPDFEAVRRCLSA
ncbi:MAG: SCP2 sterol-binding domain-containing protein [Acidimicrobiia bacterium]|nr:SCP2 sterol-binding domain-containing protein [Acidimicrobiia bacterium]